MRRYAQHRAGSGEPLLLLHGGTGTWEVWSPMLRALERRYDVLAPNACGHLDGPPMPDDERLTLEALVESAEAAMDAAGFETAHIAGNSMGGWMALELAARGRARSVLALAPAGGWSGREDRIIRILRTNRRLARLSMPAAPLTMRLRPVRRFAFRDMTPRGGDVPPRMAVRVIRGVAECPGTLSMLETLGTEGARALGELPCPGRIVWGTADRLLPYDRYGEPWRELVSGADWELWEGVGHIPMLQVPERVVQAIHEVTERAASTAGRPAGA